ncbi:hypothetical protein [Guptibacillus hwajinpoensis]|uniref:hypothetical protein n=1 Tax=Guptibacillus hwajinpoensis TaxID=208199 RepID=UPI0038514C4E
MKKVIIRSVIASLVIGLLVWAASVFISFSFSEWSFFIALGLTIVLYFFNSSGGFLSKGATAEASEAGWKVQEDNELKVNVGAVFYGSVLFTIFSLVLTITTYY